MKERVKNSYKNLNFLWNKFINLKYINKIFKVLPQNFWLFFLFIISIFTIVSFYNENKYLYYYQQTSSSDVTNNIYNDYYEINFQDVELEGNPSQFCVKFANVNNSVTSDYRYLLYHKDELVTDEIFNAKKVIDTANYCFDVPTLNKDNVKEFKVLIAPINANIDNSLAIFTSSKGVPTMSFIAVENILSVRNIIALVFIILFLLVNYFINKKSIKPEKFWLLISLIYIVFSMFLIPPYQVPDELIHYVNTVNLSQKKK